MNFSLRPFLLIVALSTPLLAEEPTKDLQDALAALKLPGVKIDLEERAVDVTAIVNLDEGLRSKNLSPPLLPRLSNDLPPRFLL